MVYQLAGTLCFGVSVSGLWHSSMMPSMEQDVRVSSLQFPLESIVAFMASAQ